MKIEEIKIMKSVLGKEIGWLWPIFLLKCLFRKRSVFNKSRWSKSEGAESEFVKSFSFASAVYLELQKKLGKEKAFEIMKNILIPIGCNEQWKHFQSLEVLGKKPMEKFMEFNDLMDRKGAPQFNKRKYIKQDDYICHFVITRCVFYDFFAEVGTPELTTMFCEVDREFFPKAFPDFNFHRGNSWENTIAYGKDHCKFVFEKKH
jgi:hypothetical protein